MRTRDSKINDASSFVKRTMVRDFIATALPTKAVCWTLVAANIFSVSFLRKIVRSLVFFYLLFLLLGRAPESEWKSSKNRSSSRSFLVLLLQFNSLKSTLGRKKKANVSNTFPANKAKETTQREIYITERERERTRERIYKREREHRKEEKSIIMLATSSSGSISGVGAMRVVARGSGRRAMMRNARFKVTTTTIKASSGEEGTKDEDAPLPPKKSDPFGFDSGRNEGPVPIIPGFDTAEGGKVGPVGTAAISLLLFVLFGGSLFFTSVPRGAVEDMAKLALENDPDAPTNVLKR